MTDPGYRIPEGEAAITEMACQLVYYPDIPEYRRILLSQLYELASWTNWERDSAHKGKDAADSWKLANDLTWGCWQMACLETLQANVASILSLLQNQDPCCDEILTYYDSTTYITIIVPGDGADPTVYGETAVADWEEWLEYVCYHGNAWVDELIRAAYTVETALDTGGLTIALLAAVLSAIAFLAVGGVLALPFIMVVVFGLSGNVSATIFAAAAVSIEDARDSIVCAIINGRDVSAAVEDALSSGTAWDLLFSYMDYDSAMAVIYEGGDGDTVFLEAEKDATCICTCKHLVVCDYATINYQSANGCSITFHENVLSNCGGAAGSRGSRFWVNWDEGLAEHCGPAKKLTSVECSDAGLFSHLNVYDIDGNPTYTAYNAGSCDFDKSLMLNKEGGRFGFIRSIGGTGGCGGVDFTLTLEWEDV